MSNSDSIVIGAVSSLTQDCADCGLVFDEELIARLLASCAAKPFVILTGLAGSGKTKVALALARWATDPGSRNGNPFVVGNRIKAQTKEYEITGVDALSVEFINDDGTIVLLPLKLIQAWAELITQRGYDRSKPPQDIRTEVQELMGTWSKKYSSQLNSFHSPLRALAFALLENQVGAIVKPHYEIVAVGADWTAKDHLLGYPDALNQERYVGTTALDLIVRANGDPNRPYFLILDEMNLSHVERYFADFLSSVESGEPIRLHMNADADGAEIPIGTIPASIPLPPNLFIIGTVNVDETTYMFSPKVLDRANVIEFRMEPTELAKYLTNPKASNLEGLDGKGADFGEAIVSASTDRRVKVPDSVMSKFQGEMLLFFNILRDHDAEFGYRVAHEASRFFYYYRLLGGYSDEDGDWFNKAMDAVIVQKFLPKLHGSRSRMEGLLWAVSWACAAERKDKEGIGFEAQLREAGRAQNEAKFGPDSLWNELSRTNPQHPADAARYPLSFAKTMRMWQKLVRDQFVSFAEA